MTRHERTELRDLRQSLSGRDLIWAAIRRQDQNAGWRVTDLVLATRLPRHTIRDYLTGLRAAGYVTSQAEAGAPHERLYRLVRDCGVDAPRVRRDGTLLPPTGRERMWRAMRILGSFGVVELRHAASEGGPAVSQGEAEHYCRALCQAGYLKRLASQRYLFVGAMDSGAHAPQILREYRVYDPNLDRIMWTSQPLVEGGL